MSKYFGGFIDYMSWFWISFTITRNIFWISRLAIYLLFNKNK